MYNLFNFNAMKNEKSKYYYDTERNKSYEWVTTATDGEFGKLVEKTNSRSTIEVIDAVTLEVSDLLKKKNKDYGDTANNPPQIFSKLTAKEGILARIDDKLSRIKKIGFDNPTDSEDTLKDLIGYLILLKVQIEKEKDVIRKRIIDSKPKIK
ncbi:MAG: hypothetical protein GOVbin962_7 [Prokaryotic dsDNA virus sp.]|nr:MAG: hypothetical protein GOVbin962_7 [Prokaryotic dsDNA virus sp.]|tara:strand:- start:32206 stop:32661 length:456 start_codon:yes stop_codon:yes gene_type:complete